MKQLHIALSFFGTIPREGIDYEAHWAGIPCDMYLKYVLSFMGRPLFPTVTPEGLEHHSDRLNNEVLNVLTQLFQVRSTLIISVPALFSETQPFIEILSETNQWETSLLAMPNERNTKEFCFFGYSEEQEKEVNEENKGFQVFDEFHKEIVEFYHPPGNN